MHNFSVFSNTTFAMEKKTKIYEEKEYRNIDENEVYKRAPKEEIK